MEKLQLKEVLEVTEHSVATFQYLLDQLTSTPTVFTAAQLQAIIDSKESHLYFFYNETQLCGMITTGSYEAPTGRKTWIEDVVIDEKYRGNGLGKIMLSKVIDMVSREGKTTLMLTSNPSRIAANALYRELKFTPKETNVYKMTINPEA